jgi:signal transduction histidine kinase
MIFLSDDARVALDAFATPVWVVDVPCADLVWANRAALTLFAASSLSELLAREPLRGASARVIAELSRLPPGARLECNFRVERPGSELTVACTCTALETEAERQFALFEAKAERELPAAVRRGADIEQRLQSHDRMAAIGHLAAGVVHGINNPLAYVIANLEYVKRLLAKATTALDANALLELSEIVEDSLDGADRVRRIVSDLGGFSSPLEAQLLAADLERAADRALRMADNEIRHRARVVREYGGIVAARGTETKLGQAILNVLINAAHAIEPGAVERNAITVRTRLDRQGRPSIEIEDTGCGIAKENIVRVFDPFFTTKPIGVGAGLGLSMAQRIVSELGGEIRLESVHGHGTKVVLALPAATSAAPPLIACESVPPFSTDRFRARVLVVDDEAAILRAFKRVLYAHEVLVASSGAEALQKLAEGGPFDAIFCDVMMPEMSGVELYQRIREHHPGQEHKIVFMTGGAFAEPAAQFIESVQNPKLKKPFTGTAARALVMSVARLS